MSYRILGFLKFLMTNAINCNCGLPVIATPKGVIQLTYIYKMAHTRKRRPQYITDNIYLNDNKCNTLAEDGDIKKRWSGYYSEMLN